MYREFASMKFNILQFQMQSSIDLGIILWKMTWQSAMLSTRNMLLYLQNIIAAAQITVITPIYMDTIHQNTIGDPLHIQQCILIFDIIFSYIVKAFNFGIIQFNSDGGALDSLLVLDVITK